MSSVNLNFLSNPTATTPVEGNTPAPTAGSKPAAEGHDVNVAIGATTTTNPGAKPVLPQPVMSPAAMMIALTALNCKMAEQGVQFGEKSLEGVRDDVKKSSAKRLDQINKHFEELANSQQNRKCGLFGAIVQFCQKLFNGDIGGAFKTIADNSLNILKDIATLAGVVVVLAISGAAAVASGGAASVLFAFACVGATLVVSGMIMGDAGIQEMILESIPDDQKETAMKALAITAMVCGIVGGICMIVGGCANPGVLATLNKIVGTASSLIEGAASLEAGIKDYQAGEARANAMEHAADADVTQAKIEELKTYMNRHQNDMKQFMESYAKIIDSTREMVLQYGKLQRQSANA